MHVHLSLDISTSLSLWCSLVYYDSRPNSYEGHPASVDGRGWELEVTKGGGGEEEAVRA